MYQDYLKRVGLNEDTMHPIQKVETKRAFMAGISSLLVHFQEVGDNPKIGEKEAVDWLEEIEEDLKAFWDVEVLKHETGT